MSTNAPPEHKKVAERDKHSKTGMQGAPKKGGAGGKGTWGVGGKDDLKPSPNAVDRNDPNYCSDDDDEIVLQKVEEQNPIEAILNEYFASGSVEELSTSVEALNQTDSHEAFVKKSIAAALEKQAYERELVSQMLSALAGKVLSTEKIANGFQRALNSIEDLSLDTPDAVDVLAKFIARAVVDEIIPPSFLKTAEATTPRANEVISLAHALVTEPHRIGRLAHIWGPGDLSSVKRLKEEVQMMLGEFLTTGDVKEADQGVRKLNAPSFYFQLVKQALRFSMSKSSDDRKKISALFSSFNKSGLISGDHFAKGFRSCQEILNDIALDVPNAQTIWNEFVQMAKEEGYLSSDFS